MPSRAYTSFLQTQCYTIRLRVLERVNALSGLYLISTRFKTADFALTTQCVNALSGLYLISTQCGRKKMHRMHS